MSKVIPMRPRKGRRFYMSADSDEAFVGDPPQEGDVVELVCVSAKRDAYWFCLRVKEEKP